VVQADGEGACPVGGQEVGLGFVKRLQQAPRLAGAGQLVLLAQAVRHRGLGPAGDYFEGVDEVLALRAELLEPLGLRQFGHRDVPGRVLARRLGGLDLVAQQVDLLLEGGLLLHERLDLPRLDGVAEVHRAELGEQAAELPGGRPHLPVKAAVGGVDDLDGLGNRLGRIVGQPVQPVVFTGVLEEVFLRPAGEQGRRRQGGVGAVVGGEDGGLVAAFGELAELPHPQPVAQAGAAPGQPHVDRLAVGELDLPGLELVLVPVRAGVFAVGQAGHPLGLQPLHQVRAVALAVEHHGEAVQQGVFLQGFRIRLAGHVAQQARQDVLFEHLDQARIGGLPCIAPNVETAIVGMPLGFESSGAIWLTPNASALLSTFRTPSITL